MLYQTPAADVDWGWDITGPLLLIVVLLGLGIPMWVSMGIGVCLLLYLTGTLPVALIGESLFQGMDAFALIAVPLFILTGDALVRTGLSNRLLDVAEATAGSARAGFGSATVLGCGFFSCISGSDAAGCAAVGRMTIDRLVESGYPRAYASALVASGACTGILIPPSIAYIVIGLILGVSTATLFVAAIIPGVMILISIMITNYVINRINGYESSHGIIFIQTLASRIVGWQIGADDPVCDPRRDLLRYLHAHRSRRRSCRADFDYWLHDWYHSPFSLAEDACEFGAGKRCDLAHSCAFPPAGRGTRVAQHSAIYH